MFSNLKYPIIQAPMAGGIATVDLALAVSKNGGLGFLAAGYKTPEAIEQEIIKCKEAALPFGVNIFVPQNDSLDKSLYLYKERLEEDFQIPLTIPKPDDDYWTEKLELVKTYKVPYVSFTFGCPTNEIIEQIKENGSYVIVTVTNLEEAKIAVQQGADAICLQGIEAGGHRATFQNVDEESYVPLMEFISTVRKEMAVPIIAAGGIINGKDIHLALNAGADVVQLGTAFLCTEESGANPVYKQALQSGEFTETALTRTFSGRLARGLKNEFMVKYESIAPAIYPAVNTLTQPIRAKALKDQNPQAMSLWASTRFKEIQSGTVKEIFDRLIKELELCRSSCF
ncbi:nitronate monooxygenase [Ureibacillus thermosphaericus]|uniref:NAD(P)H-dependent flavin oxidoreductase n=1 Tax=Ureibacillus thermosphaericus TaxID=51173 RepID=UPI0030C94C38